MNNIKLLQGDCLEQMKNLPDNSVDTIITDPPYGLSFMGKKWDYDVPSTDIWKEALRVLKPGGTALIFAGSRTQHRMAVNVEDAGFILKDCIMWLYGSGFPKATDISKQLDKMAGAEREVVGEYKRPDGTERLNRKNWNKLKGNWGDNSGFDSSKDNITAPATPEAQQWNGWKSHGLKPAYEPILVAMKPNEGTYAKNALKWGVSGLNIDGGRIPTDEKPITRFNKKTDEFFNGKKPIPQTPFENGGRFPANIILDEVAAEMLDEQSGVSQTTTNKIGGGQINIRHNDKGGASRFFYCAKASKKERNAGCEGLEEKERIRQGLAGEHKNTFSKNSHPTVKPIKLMEYLCELTKTPTGGLVLDPFMGSGTTGVACKNTNRDFIGIEMDAEYLEIAKARING